MDVHARQRAGAMSLPRARKLARSALDGRTDLARRVQGMGEPMKPPGDCPRRGGRRLAGPGSGRAFVVDDRMCVLLDCGREIAERAFDVGEHARQVYGRLTVVSLHPQGMCHLGQAPGQAAKRPGLRRPANRSKGVVVAGGGSDARRTRGGGGHGGDGRPSAGWWQWALIPSSSRGLRAPDGCRHPFPQGLRSRKLTPYIAPLTGSLPWREPHRSWRWALWPRPCTLPAAGRGQRHPLHERRRDGLRRGRSQTLAEISIERRTPSSDRLLRAAPQACGRCTRSIQSCFSSVPATAIKRSSETGSWPATTSMRARARAATSVTRSATSRITS